MSGARIYPDLFLSIGAMKAGTTWLYAVLGRHPALHVAMEKEVHYFHHRYVNPTLLSETYRLREARNRYLTRFDPDKANIDAVRFNLHWISAYLSRPVDDHWFRNLFTLRDHERYACEFSNLNALLPVEAWQQIAEKTDRLRVLYTMRDPIKRLWSHAKFHLQVTGQIDRLKDWGPEEFDHFVRQPHIWENAEYGTVLRRLREGLPEETWQAIFYEDLHADQRGQLRRIEEFLGLEPFDYPQSLLDRRFTEGPAHTMPDFFPGLFANDIARITDEIHRAGFTPPACWG
ncbi:MAG: sulfotransferase [Sulfitobacter sp.]|nr:sulfotransferase [Sulfitobacter sp.]